MKIIVIGLGSMGKRRIRLLSEYKDIQLFGIDSQEDRCEEVKEKFGLKCYASIAEAVATEHPDAAVISTSPLSHAAIIKECLENDLHVFTEINLVDTSYEDNIALAKTKEKVLFISSTPLYRKEIRKIIERVKDTKCPLNYIYHKGQYLPDWHPWESYKNYFIGNPKTNGCREIFAIELPWMVTAFGPIKKVYAVKSKNTSLNITYNDNYLVTLEHETGIKGVFAVDVVARKPYRHLDVYGEDFQISWNGTPDSLVEYDVLTKENKTYEFEDASEHAAGYASFITENQYRDELKAYLALIQDHSNKPAWSFEKDLEILNIIDQIEA